MSSFNAMGTTNGNLIGDTDLIDDPPTPPQNTAAFAGLENNGNVNDPYAELQGIFGASRLDDEEDVSASYTTGMIDHISF